ncbi:MAG: hypothetical protein R3C52_10465 [Hyphomonadaceae bacterium]
MTDSFLGSQAPEQMLRNGGLLRARLDMFVAVFFEMLNGGERLVREPYVEAYCFALQQVFNQEERRLLVTMPPRHLKSFCAAVMLPAFALGHDPRLKIAVAVYSQGLAREHAGLLERVVQSNLYRVLFDGLEVTRHADQFRSPAGGFVRYVTVGGTFTGIGVDILVLDDLIKAGDVVSATMREQVEDFYRSTAMTRFNDPRSSRVIAVQQRLHIDDFVSELIEGGQYRHLNFPSIADRDVVSPLYLEREWAWREGELLSPTRFPQVELDRLRLELTPTVFNAQYLLDPQISGGQMADWSRLRIVDKVLAQEDTVFVAQSIDTAVSASTTSDYSAVTTWAYNGTNWRLAHVLRLRCEYPDLKSTLIAHARQQRAELLVIEYANVGPALGFDLRRENFNVRWANTDLGKAERFGIALDQLYGDKFEFARNAPGFDDLHREVVGFPSARHDDIVDTISQFVRWAHGAWMPEQIASSRGQRPPRRPRQSRNDHGRIF